MRSEIVKLGEVVHTRIVIVVSLVLFALLSVVAGIVTDLHDRFVPVGLGTRATVVLDFGESGISDDEAFRQLGMLSDRLEIGLVKLAPDLSGDQSGQVFVIVGGQRHLPAAIRRFGEQPDSHIRDSEALANSYVSGQYLVTGDTTRLAEFKAWLTTHRVDNRWTEDNLGSTLELLVRQSDFGMSLLAVTALMVSLVLYWLAVKSRGRALRVLAGVSTWRIQYEDLAGFLVALSAAATICDVVAVIAVGLVQGWTFVPYYAEVLLTFEAIVVLVTMAGAVVLSVASWPNAAILAARESAVKSLRTSAVILKAVTFALVLVAVAPAFTAYMQAQSAAAEQAQWKALADQVVLSFPMRTNEREFQRLMPDVGRVIQDAEARNAVALSYTWTDDHLRNVDLGPYAYLALVNQRWFDLMLAADRGGDARGNQPVPGLIPVPADQTPSDVIRVLGAQLELSSRDRLTAAEMLSKVAFYRYAGSIPLPLAVVGGELVFPEAALVVVVPSLHAIFNDSFLVSVASSRNLLFTGLGPTQALIAQHGSQRDVQVRYVAEEGILRAQFTAYFAWLRAGSFAALIVALVVSAAIGAFIAAVLKARRDFPLRLAGQPWWAILADRVGREWAVGAVLTVLVILARGGDSVALVAGVAVAASVIAPLTHLVAARWTFTNVSLRRM